MERESVRKELKALYFMTVLFRITVQMGIELIGEQITSCNKSFDDFRYEQL